ncbi:MAG: hypothetical protein JST26_05260 [Bacteroidetes bacterium]|nr:hypothetical protein [Bacteroidota bacterium]
MKQQEFIALLKEPQVLAQADTEKLSALTQEFPFFQSAQLLYTLGLKDYAPQHYQKQLRKTAIIANNRAVLYELLHRVPVQSAPVVKEEKIEPVEPETREEVKPLRVSPVTTTSDEVKVIYITTPATQPVAEIKTKEPEPEKQEEVSELNILKGIDNDTSDIQAPDTQAPFDENKLNREIEMEVSRQLIDSYVQKEVLRTPEWHEPVAKTEEPDLKEEPVATSPGSFLDWLRKVQVPENHISEKEEKTEKKEEKPTENTKFEEKKKIIDKIIESDPGKIRLNKDKFFNASQDAKQSLLENEHLITETLAKIYALQGNTAKAIRAYEILSLKFPQKSVYFASLIEKLKTK